MKVFQGKGKTLGIVGGMGTAASNLFCDMLYENTGAESDQENINFLLLNHATMMDRTKAIEEGRADELLECLRHDIDFLEDAGVCAIAIPCNTSHFLIDDLSETTDVEILNMITETVGYIKSSDLASRGDRIGIMATDGTVKMGLYQKHINEAGFEAIVPNQELQSKVMSIIYDKVKKGKKVATSEIDEIEDFFKNSGCACVILGCTELSVVDRENGGLGEYYVDAMVCLAKAAVDRCKA